MSLFVVVRHVDERSLPLCLAALKSQAPNFSIVNCSPFLSAVKESFRLGMESKDKYLLTVDADVVLRPGSLARILQMTDSLIRKNGFLAYIEYYSNDKFRGPISNGCHLYVSRYIPIIYEYFQTISYNPRTLRPESQPTFDLLRNLGLEWVRHQSDPVGFHDYEQYFLHIFVKWRNIAVKNVQNRPEKRKQFQDLLDTLLQENPDDKDFFVAHRGFAEGLKESTVVTDERDYVNYRRFIQELGISEKRAILPEEIEPLLNKIYAQPISNRFLF